MAESVRRSATTGGKPKSNPIDFSKYRKRKPQDPKDIAQVGGHDRFAEEQALHGVDVEHPHSSSPDDEHQVEGQEEDSHPKEEHSSIHKPQLDHLNHTSRPNARYTGAHKTPDRAEAAKHYQETMQRFQSEACAFHDVKAHAAMCGHKQNGREQPEPEQNLQHGYKTENARCTGAHKIVDKREAVEYYKASCEDFEKAGYSFHDVEPHSNTPHPAEKTHSDHTKNAGSHEGQNKRCSGAHKIDDRQSAAEHYRSCCEEFEKAGYTFHDIESHAAPLIKNGETNANDTMKEQRTGGHNKRCSGAHKVQNREDAAEHYRKSCKEFENSGCRFRDVETHAESLTKTDRPDEITRNGGHDNGASKGQHHVDMNKRCSGAHKVQNKDDAANYYRNSCEEFEKPSCRLDDVESHARESNAEVRHFSDEQTDATPQHETKSPMREHGENNHRSGAHKVDNKAEAASHLTQSWKQLEETGISFSEDQSETSNIEHRDADDASLHRLSKEKSHPDSDQNKYRSGAHTIENKEAAATHDRSKLENFKFEACEFDRVEDYTSTHNRDHDTAAHSSRDGRASNSAMAQENYSSSHDEAQHKISNDYHSGAHRVSDRGTASEYYRHSFEHVQGDEHQESLDREHERRPNGKRSESHGMSSLGHNEVDISDGSPNHESTSEHIEGDTYVNEALEERTKHLQGERQDHHERTNKSNRSTGAHRVPDRAAASEYYRFVYHYTDGEDSQIRLGDECSVKGKATVLESGSKSLRARIRTARSSGAHRVPDMTEAGEYYRDEYRKAEEAGFEFRREEDNIADHLRPSVREHKNPEAQFSANLDGIHIRGSKNTHYSGAYKVLDRSLAMEHYSKFMHEFKSHHNIERMEEHLDLRALAEEANQALESVEEDGGRLIDSLGGDEKRAFHKFEVGTARDFREVEGDGKRALHNVDRDSERSFHKVKEESERELHSVERKGDRAIQDTQSEGEKAFRMAREDLHSAEREGAQAFHKAGKGAEQAFHKVESEGDRAERESLRALHMIEGEGERAVYKVEGEGKHIFHEMEAEGKRAAHNVEGEAEHLLPKVEGEDEQGFHNIGREGAREFHKVGAEVGRELHKIEDETSQHLSHPEDSAEEYLQHHTKGLRDLAKDMEHSAHELERRSRLEISRMSASRRSGAHQIRDKDAARAHYLAYVKKLEDDGYSWDRIEAFVKKIVDRVEDLVDGKMARLSGVNLHVEDFDLGKKFDILSSSREHSRERGRSERSPAQDGRGSSQGWTKIERGGSKDRRGSFESKMHSGRSSPQRSRSSSRSSSPGHEGQRPRNQSAERERIHDLRKDDVHHVPGSNTLDCRLKEASHSHDQEHKGHHESQDHSQLKGGKANVRASDGALGRRLSANVLPHLMKSARARSRSPIPGSRGPDNHHGSEHDGTKKVGPIDESRVSHHEALDRKRDGTHQEHDHPQRGTDVKGLGIEGHYQPSITGVDYQTPSPSFAQADHHNDSAHPSANRWYDDSGSPVAGHPQGLASHSHTDHSSDHQGYLSADKTEHPSPKELFHMRQASVKSPGGRKFAGSHPAALELAKMAGAPPDRKESPRGTPLTTRNPNSRKTGANKMEDKEAAATHMKACYDDFAEDAPFDRIENQAAGLAQKPVNIQKPQQRDPQNQDSPGPRAPQARPAGAQRAPVQDRARSGQGEQTNQAHTAVRKITAPRDQPQRDGQVSQGAAVRSQAIGSQRSRNQERHTYSAQSFGPPNVAAGYDEHGKENQDSQQHLEEPKGDGHEEYDDYAQNDKAYSEREDYHQEDSQDYEYEEYGKPAFQSHERSDLNLRQGRNIRAEAATTTRPNTGPLQNPTQSRIQKDNDNILRHTGMNQPGLEALSYFAGTSGSIPTPEVFSMLAGLEQHVADVDWNTEKGWTKEHTSAAMYLGITGLLVIAKNYLGVFPEKSGAGLQSATGRNVRREEQARRGDLNIS